MFKSWIKEFLERRTPSRLTVLERLIHESIEQQKKAQARTNVLDTNIDKFCANMMSLHGSSIEQHKSSMAKLEDVLRGLELHLGLPAPSGSALSETPAGIDDFLDNLVRQAIALNRSYRNTARVSDLLASEIGELGRNTVSLSGRLDDQSAALEELPRISAKLEMLTGDVARVNSFVADKFAGRLDNMEDCLRGLAKRIEQLSAVLSALPNMAIKFDTFYDEIRRDASSVSTDLVGRLGELANMINRLTERQNALPNKIAIDDELSSIGAKLDIVCANTGQEVSLASGEVAGQLENIGDLILRLTDRIDGQFATFPTSIWSPELNARIIRALRLLQPAVVAEYQKVRVGRQFDGGYIQIDDYVGVSAALSMGINDDVSWDLDMAARNITVYQFDHTIEHSPVESDRLIFEKKRVSDRDSNGHVSLNSLIRERLDFGDTDIIVKMDIESDEWAVIDSTDPGLLMHCRQFVCEFHNLNRLDNPKFYERALRCFKKMADVFFVCHVHANNCANIYNVGNLALPGSLEVTFANKGRYRKLDGVVEIFPNEIDMPNQEGRADISLGAFRF